MAGGMIGVGMAELAILLAMLGGGMGIPLGMPPGPENPAMSRVAPDSCVFYGSWAPCAAADPNSSNAVDRLLSEPEVQRGLAMLDRVSRGGLNRAQQDAGPGGNALARLLPQAFDLLWHQSGAVYLKELSLQDPDNPQLVGAAVVSVDGSEAEAARLLEQLRGSLRAADSKRVEINGNRFDQLRPDPDAPLFTWGVAQGLLIIGVGEGAVEEALANLDTEPPVWLKSMREKLTVDRPATFAYANLTRLKQELPSEPQVQLAIEMLGLGNMHTYAAISGLEGDGVLSRTLIGIDGDAQGLASLLEAEPLQRSDLERIPHDALAAFATRLDIGQLYQQTMRSLATTVPREVGQVQRQVRAMEDGLGIRLQEDVFDSLGDVWRVHTSASNGGLVSGWTASVKVRNPRKLQQLSDRLLGLLAGQRINRQSAPRIRQIDADENTVHFLSVPDSDFPMAPAWCITQEELIVGLFPQTISGYLAARDEPTIADAEAFQPAFAGNGPLAVSYVDTRPIFEWFYPTFYYLGRMGISQLQQQGIDVDISILPSVSSVGKHLQPSLAFVERTEDGLLVTRHQTLPGSSVGSTAPISIALLLPAVQAAREAARRTEAQNDLKQIMLALHNYHDVHNSFPARYSVDEDSQPLLSWRVHILPYVEQSHLYDQFHFDEPWDSEHNRQLISQMPTIYRSPGSSLSPQEGKTSYLALQNEAEQTSMQPPREKGSKISAASGTRFRDIIDGTSNTLAIVEAPDDRAVVWTKPGDFEVDAENPLQGLIGARNGGFLASFCDGSVRFISENVDAGVLKALITRAGSEPVSDF